MSVSQTNKHKLDIIDVSSSSALYPSNKAASLQTCQSDSGEEKTAELPIFNISLVYRSKSCLFSQ